MIAARILAFVFLSPVVLLSVSAQSVTLSLAIVTPTITEENNPAFFPTVSGHDGDMAFSNEFDGIRSFFLSDQSGLTGVYPTQISLFCMELAQDITFCPAKNVYTVESLQFGSSGIATGLSANIGLSGIGAERATNLELLYAHVFGSTYDTRVLTTAAELEGFQLAVWKLSQDDGFTLTAPGNPSKNFWITGAGPLTDAGALDQAQLYLTWVESNPNGPLMALDSLHSATSQDLIIPASSVFTQVPENSLNAAILGCAAFGFALWRRRSARA
jgi:hypothetical protein